MIRWKMDAMKTAEAMLNAGLNCRDIAKKTGITERAVGLAISGESIPNNQTIAKIAEAIGVEPVSLCVVANEPDRRGRPRKGPEPTEN